MRVTDFDAAAGARLRQIRTQKGLRQLDVARFLGAEQSVIQLVEAGRRRMALSEAVTIAAELDVDLMDLVP